jgi:hypothetical protein
MLLYFACFCVLTFPAILKLTSSFYGDSRDGVVYLWNIWHVRLSLEALQSPFHTTMLHFPEGSTLLGHTLTLTNSITGAGLSCFTTTYEALNILVVLSVVASGLGAFLLAYHFTNSYRASLIAGFIYAFSGYEMLHLGSHVDSTSLEWLPLFLLFWHKLLTRPSIKYGLLAALFLALNAYTNLYFLYYAALAGFIMLIVLLLKRKPDFIATRRHVIALAVFTAAGCLAVAPFLLAFVNAERTDPFLDAHDPKYFSIDALGPLMPGPLKGLYGEQLNFGEGVGESFIGLTVLGLMIYVIVKRKRLLALDRFPTEWLTVFVISLLLSLGPVLHVVNQTYDIPIMPYALLERLFPSLAVAGMPERMMSLAVLAAAVIASVALAEILRHKRGTLVAGIIFLLIAFEAYPAQRLVPQLPPIPAYVYAIRDLPDKGAVYDYSPAIDLLYQTVEEHPIYGGYIARRQASVVKKDNAIKQAVDSGNYQSLCDNGFKYVVVDSGIDMRNARLVFSDTEAGKKVFDLSTYSPSCGVQLADKDVNR